MTFRSLKHLAGLATLALLPLGCSGGPAADYGHLSDWYGGRGFWFGDR